MSRFIVFDVETPNFHNDRISAIGITLVEEGTVTGEFATLVDPQCRFDSFNIGLTGITPESVTGAPDFRELWRAIEPVMSSGVLVAHNAPFDMGVLAKCLRDYGLSWKRYVRYACTYRMSRSCYPHLDNHKLNTLCACLGIQLNHHEAGSDSKACAELLIACLRSGADINRFIRQYDMLGVCTRRY